MKTSDMLKNCLENVRKNAPLIHNITNYVTVNDVANSLLACGARPIMADDPREVEDITRLCAGLTLNLGTLNQRTIPAMLHAGKKASELGHKILLDPVGAGASALRTATARELLREIRVDAIRGNISEITTLAHGDGRTQGVDADDAQSVNDASLPDACERLKRMAAETNCLIIATGALDLVCDSRRAFVIRNGRPQMRDITGTGCQLSALITAFLAANPDTPLQAAVAAVCAMGLAGEIAWHHLAPHEGNASYRNRIIDALYQLDGETLAQGARYETR